MPDDQHAELVVTDGPLILGIGASAGGLEAFQDILSHLPRDHKLAIILVQHLDPNHESLLPELLAKRTTTPVHTAKEGQVVEGGNIYLIPPGQLLTVEAGVLRLADFAKPRGLRRPIDKFLESLALDAGPRAVGIILSGTGSDGSTGVRAIKEYGGLVFVQDPKQADYDGMPRSAIETGAEDLVLPTQEMIDVVMEYFSIRSGIESSVLSDSEFIERVAKHVRYRTGHDFASYKPATILRRLAVRMSVLGLTEPSDYLKELIANKTEAAKLFRDLLINVTSFFREPEAFEALRDEVMTPLAEGRDNGEEIRIWVPGCSTGQEAFTLAMLLADELDRLDKAPKVSIFATDIDDDALKVARRAHYPSTIIDEVPQHFLETYFESTSTGYEVGSRLRDMVRFSNQSLIKDPPFSRMDLVSCRNVTIYFESELQEFTMSVIHYALKDGGALFLGASETPRKVEELFSPINSRMRIFRRRPGAARRLDLPRLPLAQIPPLTDSLTLHREGLRSNAFADTLLNDYTPPYFVLNEKDQLVFASERAASYLRVKPGPMRTEVTQMILPDLEPVLRRLMLGRDGQQVRQEREFRGKLNGETVRLVLTSEPLDDGTWLFTIEDRLDLVDTRPVSDDLDRVHSGEYVGELETELDAARETIRTTVEELETSNEELKSSNEEMMSMNEELQSANEELSTTNEELQSKLAELRQAHEDMSNLMRSTRIATVFLDFNLRLRFFTPEARKIFRFTETDRGRRIDDISADIDMAQFIAASETAMDEARGVEADVQSIDGSRQFILRIEPYTSDDKSPVGGVVAVLTDVSALRGALKEAEAERHKAQDRMMEIEQLYDVSPQAMALLDANGRFLRANQKLAELNGISAEEHIGQRISAVFDSFYDQIQDKLASVLSDGQVVLDHRIEGETAGAPGQRRLLVTDWYPIFDADRNVRTVGLNVRDVTAQTEMSMELRRVMQELQHRVKNMLSNVLALISRARRDASADVHVIDTLAKRIEALSHTHKLLTEANWRAAELRSLLKPELVDIYGEDRVKLKGPVLTLNARAAVAIGMAIHELATNAAKYGAFSNDSGKVSLTWKRVDDGETDSVVFIWEETGGPEVTGDHDTGFGSQLIRSTVTGSLDGDVDMTWRKEGLLAEISVPFSEINENAHDPVFDAF